MNATKRNREEKMGAFEITIEDLKTVLIKSNISLNEDDTENLFSFLDFDEIEDSALTETDFDKQIETAHKEIDRQVKEAQKYNYYRD